MNSLPVLLPAFTLLFLYRVFMTWPRLRDKRRLGLLAAAIVCGVTLFGVTEILSLFRAITRPAIACSWIVISLLALGMRPYVATWFSASGGCRGSGDDGDDCNGVETGQKADDGADQAKATWFLPACVLLVMLPSLIVALAAPPNNADVIEYHLARVMHWMQNRSVAHYPTPIQRQLRFGPGMEYALLHAQLLAGSDRFANLLGWLATLGAVLAGSWLARELGAGSSGQALAALLAASGPMSMLQASTAKNDPYVAFWLVCMLCMAHAYRRAPCLLWALLAGASLGLGLLTKGTAYIFAPPLIVYIIWLLRAQLIRHPRHVLAAILMVLILNAGFWLRNLDTYHHPLGNVQKARGEFSNEIHTPAALASNVARNLALQLATNFNPRFNPLIVDGMYWLHRHLGLSQNDPRITFGVFFSPAFSWTYWDESSSGSPVQVLFFLLVMAYAAGLLARGRGRAWCRLCLAIAGSFLLFCFLLKFQSLHVRLHQPLIFLGMPCVAAALAGKGANRRLLAIFGLCLVLLAVPVHLYNVRRPLTGPRNIFTVSRDRAFTTGSRADMTPVLATAEFLRQRRCRNIGLLCDADEDEYFFWVALRESGPRNFRFEHVGVKNESRIHAHALGLDRFRPDAIIDTRCELREEKRSLRLCGGLYRLVRRSCGIRVFIRDHDVNRAVMGLGRNPVHDLAGVGDPHGRAGDAGHDPVITSKPPSKAHAVGGKGASGN